MVSSPGERRKREREERRARILQAARELFVEAGVASASMRKIAERAEYSTMALYQYFPTKEDLLAVLCQETFEQLSFALQVSAERSGGALETLKRGLKIYVDFGIANPNDYYLTFMQMRPEKMTPSPEARGENVAGEAAFDILRQSVQRCVSEGILSVDVEVASHTLWAAVHGVTTIYIAHAKLMPLEQDIMIDVLIDTIVAGLNPKQG